MKHTLRIAALVLAIAIVVHVVGVWAIPRVIMGTLLSRAADNAGGVNLFEHKPRVTAKTEEIVRERPDFAYSYCVFDLSTGPIHVRVPLTRPYTSVALYTPTSDNFFVTNDRDSGGEELDVVIVAPGAAGTAAVPSGAQAIEAPATTGLVLVRRVVERPDAFPAIDRVRNASVCAPQR